MFSLCSIIWFKKLWDYFSPVLESDSNTVVPPSNKFLQLTYNFSFNIMSNAMWRTFIYLLVVSVLVTVSMLHLIEECMEFANANTQGHDGISGDWKAISDLSELEFSSCLNSWVIFNGFRVLSYVKLIFLFNLIVGDSMYCSHDLCYLPLPTHPFSTEINNCIDH